MEPNAAGQIRWRAGQERFGSSSCAQQAARPQLLRRPLKRDAMCSPGLSSALASLSTLVVNSSMSSWRHLRAVGVKKRTSFQHASATRSIAAETEPMGSVPSTTTANPAALQPQGQRTRACRWAAPGRRQRCGGRRESSPQASAGSSACGMVRTGGTGTPQSACSW